jgi:hypothetical protein
MEPASAPRRSTRVSSFDPFLTLPAGKAPSKPAAEEEAVVVEAVEEEEREVDDIEALDNRKKRKNGPKDKTQSEVDQMLKELGSVVGRNFNSRDREKKDDSETLQYKVEVKGKQQWKDVVSREQIDQRCLTEWRDSNVPERIKRESFVTHMLSKFCIHGDLVKQWYRSNSRPPLPTAGDPEVAMPQAASVVPALASAPQRSTGASSFHPASMLATTTSTGGSECASNAALIEGLAEVKAGLVELAKAVKAGQTELTHTVNNNNAVVDSKLENMLQLFVTTMDSKLEKMLELFVTTMDTNNAVTGGKLEEMFETMKTMVEQEGERTRMEQEAKKKRKRKRDRQHNAIAEETPVKTETAYETIKTEDMDATIKSEGTDENTCIV